MPNAVDTRRRMFLGCLCVVALALAAAFAWDTRYEGDPDGLSYYNIAEQAVRGNVGALWNPYWSPLYPALNALLIATFNPGPERGMPLMHLTAVVMFAIATGSFLYFISGWLRLTSSGPAEKEERRFYTVTFFGWCIFLWAALRLVGVVYPLPDMLTLACVLAAAGVCCRIFASGGRLRQYATLGLILGVGYAGKFSVAAMAAALFLAMVALAEDRRRALKSVAVAAAAFAVVAAPVAAGISHRVGRFSLGEAGKLNYAWHVNTAPFLWTGPEGFAKGETRVRLLQSEPLVYEFDVASGGTVPIWYDPAYWHSGLKTHFSAREVARSIVRRAQEFLRGAEDAAPLAAGLAVLLFPLFRARKLWAPERGVVLLGVWGALICAPFTLVHVEFRYIAGGLFLMVLALYRIAERAADRTAFSAVARVVGLAMLTWAIAPGERALAHAARELAGTEKTPEHVEAAAELRAMGVGPGSRIAVAGYALDAYYAHIAGVRVVAQMCDGAKYAEVDWHDPQPSCHAQELLRRELASYPAALDSLRHAGVAAVITREAPEHECLPSGWHRLGGSRYWAHLIPAVNATELQVSRAAARDHGPGSN